MNKVEDREQRRFSWQGDHVCAVLCCEEHSSVQESAKGSAVPSRDTGEEGIDFERFGKG